MTKYFRLNEIDCAVCAAKAEKKVSAVKGVTGVNVDFLTQSLFVEAEEFTAELTEQIINAVKKVEPDCEVIPE